MYIRKLMDAVLAEEPGAIMERWYAGAHGTPGLLVPANGKLPAKAPLFALLCFESSLAITGRLPDGPCFTDGSLGLMDEGEALRRVLAYVRTTQLRQEEPTRE